MVGFFFTAALSLGFWSVSFSPGALISARSQIADCLLLPVRRAGLHPFAWNRNYFVLLFVGVFLSSFARPLTRKCLPLPVNMLTKPE